MNFQIWNENYDVSAKMKCEMIKNVLGLKITRITFHATIPQQVNIEYY